MTPIHERARGRWPGILPAFGVAATFLRNKHGPCPICQAGKDRFRFDDKDGSGSWFCTRCGAGNGVDLVMKINGWDFRQTAKEIETMVDGVPVQSCPPDRSDDDKRKAMKRVWEAARLITPESAAGLYLGKRVGLTEFPSALRATGRLYCHEGPDAPPTYHPAMLARISDPDGKPANVHRTYLTYEGGKAEMEKPKRVMSGSIPDGSAIRLAKHGDTLGIAEGIETALSCTRLFGEPCWAVVSADMMVKWSPPAGVSKVFIYADCDENYVGQMRAFELAHKLNAKGFSTIVKTPKVLGQDWNDVLSTKGWSQMDNSTS
jgi:putative DNA primase/helicase